jgi:putative restriction endonuclease
VFWGGCWGEFYIFEAMAEKRKLWTQEEFIVVLNLYLQMPFGQMSSTNSRVKEMAELIGRSANAVAMRLTNYAAVDPFHQKRGIKGLVGGIKQVKPYFNKYIDDREALIFKSEEILANLEGKTLEKKYDLDLEIIDSFGTKEGKTVERFIKTRVNQSAFRKIVLANYSQECAISGLNEPQLLVASHISPWSSDVKNRLNPSNGLCLNMLYDKAFDKHLISFDNDLKLMVSPLLSASLNESVSINFKMINGKILKEASKYSPDISLLERHRSIMLNMG